MKIPRSENPRDRKSVRVGEGEREEESIYVTRCTRTRFENMYNAR
jgi:hypothetical protein